MYRYCLGLGPRPHAKGADPWDPRAVRDTITTLAGGARFDLLALSPTFAWTRSEVVSSHVIVQLGFSCHEEAAAFHAALSAKGLTHADYGFGQDPQIDALDAWSPVGPGGGVFGDRDLAEDLTETTVLDRATGAGVNVIIVDRGLSRETVAAISARMRNRRALAPVKAAESEILGWTRYNYSTRIVGGTKRRMRRIIEPGSTGSEHAHMIARNVLAIAPNATIWDAPLLPLENEQDAPPRLSDLGHLFHWITDTVRNGRAWSWDRGANAWVEVEVTGPWIMVNAWGVLDPELDAELHRYADDPDHLFINDLVRLNQQSIDVVFAAGNCGEPCPDRRCGEDDTGPGRSICGLNGHPNVLTVGAVRVDGMPIALSAQGPGRLATKGSRGTDFSVAATRRAYEKPDLCAPSHFRESDDASEINTGTSAACGYAAGVLAMLRSHEPRSRRLTPDHMHGLLRKTAVGTDGQWDKRLGYGVINAARALAALPDWLRHCGTDTGPT